MLLWVAPSAWVREMKNLIPSKTRSSRILQPNMEQQLPRHVPFIFWCAAIRDDVPPPLPVCWQVCIAYPLHRGLVVIPKSVTPDRIRENLKATEVRLDTEDLQRLGSLDRNFRFFQMTFFGKSTSTVDQLWDTATDAAYPL